MSATVVRDVKFNGGFYHRDLKKASSGEQFLLNTRESEGMAGAHDSAVDLETTISNASLEREMAETGVDFLFERLNQLREGSIGFHLSLVDSISDELQFLRTFLKDSEEYGVKYLVTQIRDVANEAALICDPERLGFPKSECPVPKRGRVIQAILENIFLGICNPNEKIHHRILSMHHNIMFSDVFKQITAVKKQVIQFYEKEIVVGFDHQVEMLRDRLAGMQKKQLEVVSIVGMAGLGKTTLARKLYNDSFIRYHFYIRGWVCVSQIYRKRDLLLDILSSVLKHKEEISALSDEKLGEVLYKRLKGNIYLVVMDDIWNIGVWNDLKRYFPNDNNGSRVLFTTRHTDVALLANHDDTPHHLPFLNEDHSWHLLQKKIFWNESCPPELMDIGKQIVRKCQGLPLAIVVVAGLLAKMDKNRHSWMQVAERLSSYIGSDTAQCMDILALSYNNLPDHLKSCFLYFGTFPEAYEISVRKLIWLWIAEGFINQIGHENTSLEDVAEKYLMDLIDRNLVLVAKRRSAGGIKACRVHDLLHDLCLRKASEENFLMQFYKDGIRTYPGYDQGPSSSSPPSVPTAKKHFRLCVDSFFLNYNNYTQPFFPHIHSFVCFVSQQISLPTERISFICQTFEQLRVLDLWAISIFSFPIEIVQLSLLRYLALRGEFQEIPASIENLGHLEILIISHVEKSVLPNELWNILTLRHLCIAGKSIFVRKVGYSSVLHNLLTISHIDPTTYCQDLLARTPNLRKLGFCGSFNTVNSDNFWFPDLDFLLCLETLKLSNMFVPRHHNFNLQGIKFPPNLKRLTLSNTALMWKEMSVLGMLPYLEVLKLESHACIGSIWKTSDGGFHRLKYLRLYYIDLEQWNASNIHFPMLQHLVLHNCRKLKEIPSELGDICTLHTIEVRSCSDSAVISAREIHREQEDKGNDSLKIIRVNSLDWGAGDIF
ncbi:putative late blight resistance protein homolog R1B-23 [Cornus florida]|uniref:putative late blight resistance protein homolog R1B-23 n=1 Tax=Cornus florida TaxID=4283 RepID=UPI0028A16068|nr:putative late blight resistance protein homolog R1B-23 [Cornus florida]